MRWMLLGSLLLAGCSYRHNKPGLQSGRLTGETWYAFLNRSVFQPQCASCHLGSTAQGGFDVGNHHTLMVGGSVVPGDPDHSRLYDSVKSCRMPKGGPALTPAQIESVRLWILAGAPDDKGGHELPPPPPPKPEPKFSWLLANVFQPSCVGCHSGKNPKGDVSVVSYQALMDSPGILKTPVVPGDVDSSGLADQVNGLRMPPGPDKLPPNVRAALTEWIRKGAPED